MPRCLIETNRTRTAGFRSFVQYAAAWEVFGASRLTSSFKSMTNGRKRLIPVVPVSLLLCRSLPPLPPPPPLSRCRLRRPRLSPPAAVVAAAATPPFIPPLSSPSFRSPVTSGLRGRKELSPPDPLAPCFLSEGLTSPCSGAEEVFGAARAATPAPSSTGCRRTSECAGESSRERPTGVVSRVVQLNIAGAGEGSKSAGGKKNFTASVRHSHTSCTPTRQDDRANRAEGVQFSDPKHLNIGMVFLALEGRVCEEVKRVASRAYPRWCVFIISGVFWRCCSCQLNRWGSKLIPRS